MPPSHHRRSTVHSSFAGHDFFYFTADNLVHSWRSTWVHSWRYLCLRNKNATN
ncbi:hypothetical protein LguiB_024170 [Lonicera macranthoides]